MSHVYLIPFLLKKELLENFFLANLDITRTFIISLIVYTIFIITNVISSILAKYSCSPCVEFEKNHCVHFSTILAHLYLIRNSSIHTEFIIKIISHVIVTN